MQPTGGGRGRLVVEERVIREIAEDGSGNASADEQVHPSATSCGGMDPTELRQPQDARSRVNAVIGRWPGEESDEEILVALREMS